MREILDTLLTREGYRVRLAASGAEGIELARSIPFDAAIVDIMMPGMGGIDTLDELKKNRRRIAGTDDHGVRVGRDGDIGHEARRVRLHQQTVQERRGTRRRSQCGGATPAEGRKYRAASGAAGDSTRAFPGIIGRSGEDEAGVRLGHPSGAQPLDHPDCGRERNGKGAGGAGDSFPLVPVRPRLRDGELRETCRPISSNRRCSATSRGRSPAPCIRRRGCATSLIRGAFSSMRSATSPWKRRASCCA